MSSAFFSRKVRRVSRPVTDPAHIVTEFDSIETAVQIPGSYPDHRLAGKRLRSSQLACNIPHAVGVPAGVFLSVGLGVWEDWLIEFDGHAVKWHVGRVFGPHALWPEDRPI